MPGISAEQQNLAERLGDVLRRFAREGGDMTRLERNIGHTRRDFNRWAKDTTMPAHVLLALLDELPRHLANELIGSTGLRLVARDCDEQASYLKVSASASALVADITERMADGEFCHRDTIAVKQHAQRTITDLQSFVGA